jgi:dUTP pyrophosphatase
MRVKWAKLYENAVIPTLGTGGAMGWDFAATKQEVIPPTSQVIVGTGIACEIPPGWGGLIRGRSGFCKRTGVIVSDEPLFERRAIRNAGAIDSDYRGEVGIMLINPTKAEVVIEKGQAFAQMVIVPCLIEGEEVPISELQRTIRGAHGYGSTGEYRG